MILLESIDSRILVQVFRRICRDHRNHLLLSFNEESRFLFRETDTVEKKTLPIEIRTVLSRKTFASLFSSFIRPVWIIRLPLWRVVESRLLEHSRGRRGWIGSIDPDRRRSFLNNQNPEEHIESALVAVTNFSSFFFVSRATGWSRLRISILSPVFHPPLPTRTIVISVLDKLLWEACCRGVNRNVVSLFEKGRSSWSMIGQVFFFFYPWLRILDIGVILIIRELI